MRAFDAVALTACEVLVLTAASFHVVASHYPEVRWDCHRHHASTWQVAEALRSLAPDDSAMC